MSWLYSQALAEEYSAANSWDGEPCAQLNVMPTQHKFWRNDKTMECSDLSRFGLTLQLLTEVHGEALLTWYLEDSRARTLASQDQERGLPAADQDYGRTWSVSFARYDLPLCSWRMSQHSLLGDSESFSETWPKAGSMRNGECWEQTMLELRISEKESGFWPTPTVHGNNNRAGISPKAGDGLATAARKYPTPKAGDWRGSVTEERAQERAMVSSRGVDLSEDLVMRGEKHGGLNPPWVEWLMGFPIGWTCLNPLGMHKYQEWLHWHSINSGEDCEEV